MDNLTEKYTALHEKHTTRYLFIAITAVILFGIFMLYTQLKKGMNATESFEDLENALSTLKSFFTIFRITFYTLWIAVCYVIFDMIVLKDHRNIIYKPLLLLSSSFIIYAFMPFSKLIKAVSQTLNNDDPFGYGIYESMSVLDSFNPETLSMLRFGMLFVGIVGEVVALFLLIRTVQGTTYRLIPEGQSDV